MFPELLLTVKPVMQKQTHLVSPAWSKARLTAGVSFVLDATDDSGDNRFLSLTKHEIIETQQEPGEHASATHTDPEMVKVEGPR